MSRDLRLSIVMCCIVAGCVQQAPAVTERMQLPATFAEDRVILTPTTTSGHTLSFMTDSGGGANMLLASSAAKLQLPLEAADIPGLKQELGAMADEVRLTRMPAFQPGKGIPAPLAMDGKLMVMPDAFAQKEALPGMQITEGFLGNRWLADRVWTWDYPGKRFYLEPTQHRPDPAAQAVPLGFLTNMFGKRVFSMPRITIRVDGQELPMLLDTGASTVLTPAALSVLADGRPAERATSMIVDQIFKQWRNKHPEWRVIDHAQAGSGSAMIEVPQVEIAGHVVGPVWFTHRADKNFHEMMSSMMDQRVDGAIGGNALRHFVMRVDYPKAMAYFRCVVACRPVK